MKERSSETTLPEGLPGQYIWDRSVQWDVEQYGVGFDGNYSECMSPSKPFPMLTQVARLLQIAVLEPDQFATVSPGGLSELPHP